MSAQSLRHVHLFMTSWTVAQAPLSMGFPTQEYCSGLPFPSWYQGFPDSSVGKESTCNVGDLGSIPGLGRSPAEGKGYLLQYSGLENSNFKFWCWKRLLRVPWIVKIANQSVLSKINPEYLLEGSMLLQQQHTLQVLLWLLLVLAWRIPWTV